MDYFRDTKYPNGWTKLRLYEVMLNHRNFGISDAEYEENVRFLKIDQDNRERNCTWFKNDLGRLIIAGLQLEDKNLQIEITKDGFSFISKPPKYRQVKLFISYAREDVHLAERLFDELKTEGFEPWLDKDGILGGEPWKSTIEKTIRSSDYFLALLSTNSVAKKGFVQREILRALEVLEELPPPRIFIIPLRLDDCEPPHAALTELNHIDLFPGWVEGFTRLVKALRADAASIAGENY